MEAVISEYFSAKESSVIRLAQIEYSNRKDVVKDINVAIGNVSLPMHPSMMHRMYNLHAEESPFRGGVVKYSDTVGQKETREAFLNIISSGEFSTEGLNVQVTNGGSQAIDLTILGVCGRAGAKEKPLLVIDPTYTNYQAKAQRLARGIVSIKRTLQEDGRFTLPEYVEIENVIRIYKPGAMLVIPYDNPTGQLYERGQMIDLGKLCVKYNLWMISDEAYRELYYTNSEPVSIWGLTNNEVPGIEGRRISIETASKVWNACGLRIGALITDNKEFHRRAVAENTSNLCANVIGQYIFGALAHESPQDLKNWYGRQKSYYKTMISTVNDDLKQLLPGIIVSSPSASIYSVIDVRNITKPGFSALDFVMYCAREGNVPIDGNHYTLLVAPMVGFYNIKKGEEKLGTTQMRIAYVESQKHMIKVPLLFKELLSQYETQRD